MPTENIDLVIRDRIDKSIKSQIAAIGVAAEGTGLQLQTLKTRLQFGGGEFATIGFRTSRGFDQASRSVNRFSKSVGQSTLRTRIMNSDLLLVIRNLRTIAGIAAIIGAGRGFTRAIDSFQQFQNQLRGVAESQGQVNQLTEKLFEISNRARVPVADLALIFKRFDLALKELGKGQATTLKVTESIATLLTLGGANAEESSAVLRQLSQAFNAAKLQGDEFKSVTELLPEALRAISRSTGVAAKDMKEFAKAGGITSKVLLETFLAELERARAEIEDLPFTVGQALTTLTNNFARYFGEFDNRIGLTRKLAGAVKFLAENMNVLEGAMFSLAVTGAAVLVPALGKVLHSAVATRVALAATFGTGVSLAIIAASGAMFAFRDSIFLTADQTYTLGDAFNIAMSDIVDLLSDATNAVKDLADALFGTGAGNFASLEGALQGVTLSVAGYAGALEFANLATRDFVSRTKVVIELLKENAGAESDLRGAIDNFNKNNLTFEEMFAKSQERFTSIYEKALEERTAKLEAAMKKRQFIIEQRGRDDLLGKDGPPGIPGPGGDLPGRPKGKTVSAFNGLNATLRETNQQLEFVVQNLSQSRSAAQEFANNFSQAFIGLGGEIGEFASKSSEALAGIGTAFVESFTGGGKNKLKKFLVGFLAQLLKFFVLKAHENRAFSFLSILQGTKPQGKKDETGFEEAQAQAAALKSTFEGLSEPINRVSLELQTMGQTVRKAMREMGDPTELEQLKKALDDLGTPNPEAFNFDQFKERVEPFIGTVDQLNAKLNAVGNVEQPAAKAAEAIKGIDEAAKITSSGMNAFSAAAVSALNAITESAKETKTAVESIGSSGGNLSLGRSFAPDTFRSGSSGSLEPLSGLGGGGFFQHGGYTGNVARNRIAGLVHGQEFVMPADVTRRYRGILEAMRGKRDLPSVPQSSTKAEGVRINVQNYGSASVSARQLSDGEILILIDEKIKTGAPKAVAQDLRNSNSRVSKSIGRTTTARRRR